MPVRSKSYIVTDSMSHLLKIKKEYLYPGWIPFITESHLERLIWIFHPGNASVKGNQRVCSLAGDDAIDNKLTLDPQTAIHCRADQLSAKRPPSTSCTLSLLNDKDVW